MRSSFAASRRPCPARIILWESTRIGSVKPKRSILSAICRICRFECVLELCGQGLSAAVDWYLTVKASEEEGFSVLAFGGRASCRIPALCIDCGRNETVQWAQWEHGQTKVLFFGELAQPKKVVRSKLWTSRSKHSPPKHTRFCSSRTQSARQTVLGQACLLCVGSS